MRRERVKYRMCRAGREKRPPVWKGRCVAVMKDIREKAWKQKQWVTLLILTSANVAVYANIQGFMALLPMVQEEFLISRAQVGLYSSFYFMSAALISVFSGRIVDRLGTKRGLVLGVTVVGIMIFLHSLSPFFGFLLILAFFTGIAYSIITPAVNRGVLEVSEPSKRGFSMGIVHGGGGFGGFIGAAILPFLGEIVGWRTALLFGSIFAVMIALFISWLYRPGFAQNENKNDSSPEGRSTSLKEDLLLFLRNRYLLCICMMGIAFGMSISSITGHFPLYLSQDLGYSVTFAGLGLGIFHIGGIAGQPFWGLINENVFHGDRRKGLFTLGVLIAGLILFFGLVVSRFPFPPYAILLFSFLLGFCAMGVIAIYFTAIVELVSNKHIGMITGIALIFPRTSTMLTPPLFGLIADLRGAYSSSWIILGTIVLFFTVAFLYFSGKYSRFSSEH